MFGRNNLTTRNKGMRLKQVWLALIMYYKMLKGENGFHPVHDIIRSLVSLRYYEVAARSNRYCPFVQALTPCQY